MSSESVLRRNKSVKQLFKVQKVNSKIKSDLKWLEELWQTHNYNTKTLWLLF